MSSSRESSPALRLRDKEPNSQSDSKQKHLDPLNHSQALTVTATMESANAMPVLQGPVDKLRHDNLSYALDFSAQHPVQSMQSAAPREWSSKLDSIRRTYGSHMAMRLATEREFFARTRRLPGLESSKIALQTLNGTDETIEFSDYLDGELPSRFVASLPRLLTGAAVCHRCPNAPRHPQAGGARSDGDQARSHVNTSRVTRIYI
jgi:proteasome maturation protein